MVYACQQQCHEPSNQGKRHDQYGKRSKDRTPIMKSSKAVLMTASVAGGKMQ
jgi:hypothetical protein